MRQFGELEAVVMDVLWSHGSATVRDVLEELRSTRSIAYTTVMTVMDNLHRKDFVAREMEGRAWRYEPVKTREQFTADLMLEVLEGAKDRTGTLMHFVDAISAPELRRLRRILAADEGEAPRS